MLSSFADFDDLFDQFRRLEQDLSAYAGRGGWPPEIRSLARGAYPPINVGATPEKVDVYLFAAGLDPQSIGVSIHRNLLTVAGQRHDAATEKGEYYRKERFDGDFRRVITLPDDVDPEQVEAKYTDGVLQISVQRREAARPRNITVQ